jgi:squalene synthase HpnC
MPSETMDLQQAFAHCLTIAQNHYENFPVASKLLGQQLRLPIAAVYAFARQADDFADEGDFAQDTRIELLKGYARELEQFQRPGHAASENPVFIALRDVIENYQIPVALFTDLLDAFTQDVTKTRYENFNQVLDYCQKSANPVGRILLYLNNNVSEKNLAYSDAICSGLQLINFYQDIHQDLSENDRLYLPLDELQQFGVTIDQLKQRKNTFQTQQLMQFQLQRARTLYETGKPLCFELSGRFALEIRAIYTGGLLILNKLQQHTDCIYKRPRLSRLDKFKILLGAIFFR